MSAIKLKSESFLSRLELACETWHTSLSLEDQYAQGLKAKVRRTMLKLKSVWFGAMVLPTQTVPSLWTFSLCCQMIHTTAGHIHDTYLA